MFSNLTNLVQKAQSFIDPHLPLPTSSDRHPSKAALFRHQFRLPDSQNPLHEITAELTLPQKTNLDGKSSSFKSPSGRPNWDPQRGAHYVGRLHLSEQFLCFSTTNSSFISTASISASSTFTGSTNGAGPAGNGFTLPLCAVRRVERLHSQSYMFALAISTWNGYPAPDEKNPKALQSQGGKTAPAAPKLVIQLAGSRAQCERFCDGLKRGLREGMREVDSMRGVVGGCYSEFMLAAEAKRREKIKKEKEGGAEKSEEKLVDAGDEEQDKTADDGLRPPDSGLGSIFRYPGDPRKLRDKGKMRLWYEYLRGEFAKFCSLASSLAYSLQKMVEMPRSCDNRIYLVWLGSDSRIVSEARSGSLLLVLSICDYNSPNYIRKRSLNTKARPLSLLMRLKKISIEVCPSILASRARKVLAGYGECSLPTVGPIPMLAIVRP